MQTHAIVEVEEGALTVTLGRRNGLVPQVLGSRRVRLPDLASDSVASALRSLAADMLGGVEGVHVIFGERRLQHAVAKLPKMPPADVEAFVVREALRLTGMPSAAEVLVAARLVRRPAGGKLTIGITALPRSVWEPIGEAFRTCRVPVLSLHSMESCLALAAPENGAEASAVLEFSSGRARFVLCDGRGVVQVRRFMVGRSEANPEALAVQLAMELPRTIDWLRVAGHQPPSVLVLGHRIDIGEESLDLGRGEVARIVAAPTAIAAGETDEAPGLAAMSLLQELGRGSPPPSLLAGLHLRLPPSRLRLLWIPAALLACGACWWSALLDLTEAGVLQERLVQVASEREVLQRLLAEVRAPAAEPGGDAERLARALGARRPVSRLVADVSNAASGDVLIDALQFASAEGILISGVVRGPTRAMALQELSGFAGRVRGLPYLGVPGQEEVREVQGMPNHFRFRFGLPWRDS